MGYTPTPIPQLEVNTKAPALSERLLDLTRIRAEALAAHELARMHMAKRVMRNFRPFKEGEEVWLDTTNIKILLDHPKLKEKRTGPFKIRRKLSNWAYELESDRVYHWA